SRTFGIDFDFDTFDDNTQERKEMHNMTSIALPGQSLGPTSSTNIGEATHIHNNNLCASISGPIHSKPSTSKTQKAPTLSIHRTTGPLLPSIGTKILGRITRTQTRQANISILTIISGSTHHNLNDPLPGTIRQQDIRATEIDKVKVSESFRVGDIVRAVVISLGDERAYYLSTAKNELGVVMATSEFGNQMVPVSWREFEDAEMGVRELRKVAKPV
ncbi:Exosome complex component CSL4, partial [Pseudocercospora fuligena]